ncbi:MAG: hypothetical protein ACKO6L_05115 [Flavobacteriales bacterium]
MKKPSKSENKKKDPINPKTSTIVIVRCHGNPRRTYSIHRETCLRNPETDELIRMTAWHNVPIYPTFWPLDAKGKAQFALVFPPLPTHWKTFEFWEMRGENPFYTAHIKRSADELYIVNFDLDE